jgi:hypothetical protein
VIRLAIHRAVLLLLVAGVLAACATTRDETSVDVQRAMQGPTAEEVWMARFVQGYGRFPTFDEKVAWKEGLEARILAFLSQRPEIATSPQASQLRFQRSVVVGMQKSEVVLLLEQPDASTSDRTAMRAGAGRFWSPIGAHAKEMWTYPPGWRLYFDGDRLVDMIVAGRSPLQ